MKSYLPHKIKFNDPGQLPDTSKALEWLGDRYLLSKPLRRIERENTLGMRNCSMPDNAGDGVRLHAARELRQPGMRFDDISGVAIKSIVNHRGGK